jgi:outer membrane protein TolC
LADLDRDFRKAKDLLDNLVSQEKLSRENAEETESAASLTYQSYRAGKQQYLDVETANLKSLEAQVALAEVRANILTTIAQLQYLSTGKEDSHE